MAPLSEVFNNGVSGAFYLSVIAFSAVFLVLAILTGVIFAMRYITQFTEKKKPNPVAKSGGTSSSAPAGNDAIVAAITAALAAHMGGNGGFVIKSVSPVSIDREVTGWMADARYEGLRRPLGSAWK